VNDAHKETASVTGEQQLAADLARVRLAAFDVDGVLTDGGIYLSADAEAKRFNTLDGFGLRALADSGVEVAIITARTGAAVTRRAAELRITHVFQGEKDKIGRLQALCTELGIGRDEVLYMGDDLPDLRCLLWAGVSAAPANACRDIRERARLVTTARGGDGAVREVAEAVLRAKGLWAAVVEKAGGGREEG